MTLQKIFRSKKSTEDKKEKTKTQKKETGPSCFDILTELERKQRPWKELDDGLRNAYNQFLINRMISSKPMFVAGIAELSRYGISDEIHYEFLRTFLFPQKYYFDYKAYRATGEVDDKSLYSLMKEYKISKREAISYYEQLIDPNHVGGKDELLRLNKKWEVHYDMFGKKPVSKNK